MSLTRKTSILLALAAFLLLAPGCKKQGATDPEVLRREGELKDIHELYAQYIKNNQRPPQQASDLTGKAGEVISPAGVRALKSGNYEVVWGVDVNSAPSGTVLAYEKDAPSKGGAGLTTDNKVRTLSADELKSALKSGK